MFRSGEWRHKRRAAGRDQNVFRGDDPVVAGQPDVVRPGDFGALAEHVGARRADIRRQFIIEAFSISLLGGLFGVIMGVAIAQIVATAAGWPTVVTATSIILSTSVSIAVGLVSGIYPAVRAAELDPTGANHEILAEHLARSGDPGGAVEALRRARSLGQDPVGTSTRAGRLLMRSGRPREALAEFEQALAADPEHGPALRGRSEARAALGQ